MQTRASSLYWEEGGAAGVAARPEAGEPGNRGRWTLECGRRGLAEGAGARAASSRRDCAPASPSLEGTREACEMLSVYQLGNRR